LLADDSATLVVRDGSGSMTTRVGSTQATARDVATSLAIYFSQSLSGEFKDKFITFSSKPRLIDMSKCKNLREKIELCMRESEVANTNIERTFDLVLDTAICHKLNQADLPKNILIISDMEFDMASDTNFDENDRRLQTLFEQISAKFSAHGYAMPRLIFWNVCSRTLGVPLRENALGLALVSGFSPATFAMVQSGKLDPLECLKDMLNSPRYDAVSRAIKA